MSNNISSIWTSSSKAKTTTIIIPDGCRDLIVTVSDGDKPHWFVSPLLDQSKSLQVEKNTAFLGFRLKPGTQISERKLLDTIENNNVHVDEIQSLIDDFTKRDNAIKEVLNCLASSDVGSVKNASKILGVNIRTLQRLVFKSTERTPSYWFQLARVRKAAKSLTSLIPSTSLAAVADINGFSDQSHMNREFKRWFNISPSEVQRNSDVMAQLDISD